MKHSLRSHLSLAILLAALFTVILISFLANTLINDKFRDYIVERQKNKSMEIVADLSQQYDLPSRSWDSSFVHMLGMYVLYDGYIIKVYDGEGQPVWDAEQHDMTLCNQIMRDISTRMSARLPKVEGEFISQSYDLAKGGKKIGSVTISYFGPYFLSENDFQFLSTLNGILFFAGTLSLLLALTAGWFLAKRISSPIVKTIDITKRMAEGDYAIEFENKANIRELDNLAQAVQQLGAALSRQESLRKQMTADVAHELRTPLTIVGANLEAMIDGFWEASAERLQSCQEEIGRLSGLVSDLERLAKAESESSNLEKTHFDLLETVRAVADNLSIQIAQKRLSVEIRGEKAVIFADRGRLSQVALNLLSNAIKYTPEEGHIEVNVKKEPPNVVLTVADDGPGIGEEDLSLIFERFYRADKSRSRKTGGSGIGLSIVKSIVRAHGGTVKASSRLGEGSAFAVILPEG
jgi:signal transduction histidine kinase